MEDFSSRIEPRHWTASRHSEKAVACFELSLINPVGPVGVSGDLGALRYGSMGRLEDVRARLSQGLNVAEWRDPWIGVARGDGWRTEVNIGVDDPITRVNLRMSGEGLSAIPREAIDSVKRFCVETGWRALDTNEWAFLA
jgi:hypothetical protein